MAAFKENGESFDMAGSDKFRSFAFFHNSTRSKVIHVVFRMDCNLMNVEVDTSRLVLGQPCCLVSKPLEGVEERAHSYLSRHPQNFPSSVADVQKF